jgi:metacaspase-1
MEENEMAKGIALTIGLNSVDPGHYGGWDGTLNACEADAHDMAAIAKKQKFNVKTLLTKAATRSAVLKEISDAATALKSGDIFMLSYSGHGGQVPDMNGDEPDQLDETICLYDGELIDDEMNAAFTKISSGVRVLVFSDSCHSGTMTKVAYYYGTAAARTAASQSPNASRCRAMPPDVALRTYRQNQEFYDAILRKPELKDAEDAVKAAVLLISGCMDNQTSSDGDANGLFTSQLLAVWRQGKFKGNYKKFYSDILRRMPPDQSPNYYRTGKIDPQYEKQKPFTI